MKSKSEILHELICQKEALLPSVEEPERTMIRNQVRYMELQAVLCDRLSFLEALMGVGFDEEISRQIDSIRYLLDRKWNPETE